MTTPLSVVKQTLCANGFTNPAIDIRIGDRTASVVVRWPGNGMWAFDAGMLRSMPITVAAVTTTAEGRNLTRVLLDLADDDYEAFTDTPVANAEDAGESLATEAVMDVGDEVSR